MIQIHKEAREQEALTVTGDQVRAILETGGVPEEKAAAFEERFGEEFGKNADLSPKNIIDPKKLEVVTPDVSIKVAPDRGDLLQTRILGGVKYILIRADESVEVNGVPICISDSEAR